MELIYQQKFGYLLFLKRLPCQQFWKSFHIENVTHMRCAITAIIYFVSLHPCSTQRLRKIIDDDAKTRMCTLASTLHLRPTHMLSSPLKRHALARTHGSSFRKDDPFCGHPCAPAQDLPEDLGNSTQPRSKTFSHKMIPQGTITKSAAEQRAVTS